VWTYKWYADFSSFIFQTSVIFPKALLTFLITAEPALMWYIKRTVQGNSKCYFTTGSALFRTCCNQCTSRATFLCVLLFL